MAGSAFDVVLDNNGKDLDTVRFVWFKSWNPFLDFGICHVKCLDLYYIEY